MSKVLKNGMSGSEYMGSKSTHTLFWIIENITRKDFIKSAKIELKKRGYNLK